MDTVIATTKYGKLAGTFTHGMCAFLNIPYAKYERFLPAVEPDHWDDILDATHYGHCQPQFPGLHWEGLADTELSETLGLTLNVWTPACDGELRPVVVWIHGGGNTEGSHNCPCWDGPHLVGGHDVVMVSISYRLGYLGNLYLGGILGEKYQASGSLGDLDKIMALRWVRENIANFGGDPQKVTIMGQSGGAKSVGDLVVSPLAKGLFQQAIMISGSAQCLRDLQTAELITEQFLDVNGIRKSDAARLLTMPTEEFIQLQRNYMSQHTHMSGPTIDGIVFTHTAEDYLETGASDDLKIMIGYTKAERSGRFATKSMDPEARRDIIRKRYGRNSNYLIQLYEQYLPSCAEYEAFENMENICWYQKQSIQFAEMLSKRGIPTWCYRWDYTGGGIPNHLSELSYIFRTNIEEDSVWGHPHQCDELSPMLNNTWISFIKNGDPNNPLIPKWTAYTNPYNGTRLYITQTPSAEPFYLDQYDHNFSFLEFQLPRE